MADGGESLAKGNDQPPAEATEPCLFGVAAGVSTFELILRIDGLRIPAGACTGTPLTVMSPRGGDLSRTAGRTGFLSGFGLVVRDDGCGVFAEGGEARADLTDGTVRDVARGDLRDGAVARGDLIGTANSF